MTKKEYECTILIYFGWLMGWSIAGVYHITVRNEKFDQLRRGMCPSMMWGFCRRKWGLNLNSMETQNRGDVWNQGKIIVYIYMGLYRFMQLNHGSYGGNQTTGVYPTLRGHEMLGATRLGYSSKYFGVDVTQVVVFVSKTQIMSLKVPHAMSI